MSLSSPNPLPLSVRVYYEDTDATGVVYHAGYLRFFERARTEWLRRLGFSQDALAGDLGIGFTISHIEIDFRRPARLDDLLDVSAELSEVRRASFAFEQCATRATTGEPLAMARARVACIRIANFKPCGLPVSLRQCIEASAPRLSQERSTAE